MRFDTFFLTIKQVIIHRFMKSLCKLLHAFAFKIHKPVDTLYFTEENVIFLAKRDGTNITFVIQWIHNLCLFPAKVTILRL